MINHFDALTTIRQFGKGNPTDIIMSYRNFAACIKAIESSKGAFNVQPGSQKAKKKMATTIRPSAESTCWPVNWNANGPSPFSFCLVHEGQMVTKIVCPWPTWYSVRRIVASSSCWPQK